MAQALPCEWRDIIMGGNLNLFDHWGKAADVVNFNDNPMETDDDAEVYDYAVELKLFDEEGIKIICKRILDKRLRDGKL